VVERTAGPCEVDTKYLLNVMILVGVCRHYVIDRHGLTLVFHSVVEVKLYFSLKSAYGKCNLYKFDMCLYVNRRYMWRRKTN
jgi:hypothetical protein